MAKSDEPTEKQNFLVYKPTTSEGTPDKKKKRRDKSDLGESFIPPDGGWGWFVCIAAGISNMSILPALQQFGLVYRDRLNFLGMTSTETTSIINTQAAVSALTGLINGAMFRRFTFRQVAFVGGLCCFFGILGSAWCWSFTSYMIIYALLYGFGMGISMSASSLALNTYFKENRRKAMGFSWTITGIGPIIFPHIAILTLTNFGYEGAVFVFSAISLQAVVGSLIYQPAQKHSPKPEITEDKSEVEEHKCDYCRSQILSKKRKHSIFSSQYLFDEDHPQTPGFEVIGPGSPMMTRANDGLYGSKLSLASVRKAALKRQLSTISRNDVEGGLLNSNQKKDLEKSTENIFQANYFHKESNEPVTPEPKSILKNSNRKCTCSEERTMLKENLENELNEEDEKTFFQKVSAFFDLDLLKDPVFVVLVSGLTVILFGEVNFSILTPFILGDFGFTKSQISIAMSIIGGMDLTVRFLAPFVTQKIPWNNTSFFAFGMIFIAVGRGIVVSTSNYYVLLSAFFLIGFGKGFRTIFSPLIIPSYVPLKRLPAASGLQLISTGVFTISCGPLVGLIRDAYGFSVTIHIINALTYISLFGWGVMALILRRNRRKKAVDTKL
ncbi:hypothetical protein ACFFRR_003335 [Megaselia abdita]